MFNAFVNKFTKISRKKLHKNCLLYYFDKLNLNGMYPDLRFRPRKKIIFFLSNSLAYSSIKPLFVLFKNLVKNF